MPTAGLFITGTDTEVGKTYVTCLIAREMRARGVSVGAYKPACSGGEENAGGPIRWPDIDALMQATAQRFPAERICPQRFTAPLAPPVAARAERRSVDARLLRDGAKWWDGRVELLLVEGAGGLLCPLTDSETIADLAVELGFPLLLVARLGLGTINHTLLTVEAAERRGLRIAGIVLNDADPNGAGPSAESNPGELAARCHVPVLGMLARNERRMLRRGDFRVSIDWLALAQR